MRRVACSSAVLLYSLQPANALALGKGTPLERYVEAAWGTEQGLPDNDVFAMVQTRDGYLWMGTEDGMARFDGTRITVFDQKSGVSDTDFRAMLETTAGQLIAGGPRGLYAFDDGRFRARSPATLHDGYDPSAIAEDRNHTLWVAGAEGLTESSAAGSRNFHVGDGLPSEHLSSLATSPDGDLWIGTASGLARLHQGAFTTYTTRDGLPSDEVAAVIRTQDGRILVGSRLGLSVLAGNRFQPLLSNPTDIVTMLEDREGTVWIGAESGLFRLKSGPDGERVEGFPAGNLLATHSVQALLEDREGSLWIGTIGSGLVRLAEPSVETIGVAQGLASPMVLAILQDHQGAMWLGYYSGGVSRLQDGKITTWGLKDGLKDDFVQVLEEDRTGGMWLGTRSGLAHIDHGKVAHVWGKKDGMPGEQIASLLEDPTGTLWIGFFNQGLASFHEGRFEANPLGGALKGESVETLYRDPATGAIWLGLVHGAARMQDRALTIYGERDGLCRGPVTYIGGQDDGSLWLACLDGGLTRLKDGHFTTVGSAEGLLNNGIYEVLDDRAGNYWMGCNRGIFHVPRRDLDAVADGKLPSLSPLVLDRANGMASQECNGGNPAGIRASDGRLWFATAGGVAIVDPAHLHRNTSPPPASIVSILADDASVSRATGIPEIPAGTHSLQLVYQGISFLSPSRMTFRYRLDGWDSSWVEASNERRAFYRNLPPGNYRFHVTACNADGICNEDGAAIDLHVAGWLRRLEWSLLAIFGAGALLYGGSRLSPRRTTVPPPASSDPTTAELRIQLGAARMEMERLANIDPLTGSGSRRRFDGLLESEWRRATRGTPLALLFAGVDRMDALNKAAGRPAGDDCLRLVAGVLTRAAGRAGDLVMRYEDDVFAVVLPGTDESAAATMAEKLRLAVESMALPHPAGAFVTVSVGAAVVRPAPDGQSVSLIRAADEALRAAKARGGNAC